jgi:hypothetical protein
MAIDPAKPAPRTAPATPAGPAAPITPKPHARLEKWMWILIYVGIAVTALGWYTGRTDAALGWLIAVPGVVAAVAGVALIFVRSRLD